MRYSVEKKAMNTSWNGTYIKGWGRSAGARVIRRKVRTTLHRKAVETAVRDRF